jgi:hypothetical protein
VRDERERANSGLSTFGFFKVCIYQRLLAWIRCLARGNSGSVAADYSASEIADFYQCFRCCSPQGLSLNRLNLNRFSIL